MRIKKYTLHILILMIILFGLSGPMFQVSASVVNPNEPCNGPSVTSSTNQPCQPTAGLESLMFRLQQLLNSVIPVLIALGVVYFVWGVVQYVIGDSEEAKKKGRDRMIFGIIGLAVIIGLWGLVFIVTNTFGLGTGVAPSNTDLQNLLPR